MVQKMTALWLIILTMVTCASVPVLMIILTSPHPSEFVLSTLYAESHFSSLDFFDNLKIVMG